MAQGSVLLGVTLMMHNAMAIDIGGIDLLNLLPYNKREEYERRSKLHFGHPCKSNSECYKSSSCIDGRCDCDETKSQIREFTRSNYRCSETVDVIRYHSVRNFRFCYPTTDTCIDGTCKRVSLGYQRRDWQCFCGDDKVLVEKTCRKILWANHSDDCRTPDSGEVPMCDFKRNLRCNTKHMKCDCFNNFYNDRENSACITTAAYIQLYPNESLVGLGESCGIVNNLPKWCDETMSCENSTCKCKQAFYPIKNNGTCESKEAFAAAKNLTSYKVMPEDYCDNSDECITGLTCYKNLCACPYPCTYDHKTISCDCGEVSHLEGASSAILIGVIGGFGIMMFWYYTILNTMKKAKKKFNFNSNYEGVTHYPLSDPATSYSIQPSTHDPLPYSLQPSTHDPLPYSIQPSTHDPLPNSLQPSTHDPLPYSIQPSTHDPLPFSTPSYSLQPTTSHYSASAPTLPSSSVNSPIPVSDPTSPPPSYNSVMPDSDPTSPPPSYNEASHASALTSPPLSYVPSVDKKIQ